MEQALTNGTTVKVFIADTKAHAALVFADAPAALAKVEGQLDNYVRML